MGLYMCSRCGEIKDNDWEVGTEDPDNENELVCPRCYSFFDDEDEEPQDLEL